MWGTHERRGPFARHDRFIPTHVGNTTTSNPSQRLGSVHPHACGEHSAIVNSVKTLFGSSPRMWGTLFFQLVDYTTFFATGISTGRQDYPQLVVKELLGEEFPGGNSPIARRQNRRA